MQRYGAGMLERLSAMFAEAGLPYREELDRVPNSRRALMLGEFAREQGCLARLHPQLFDAYWARGLDLGDEEVLVSEGAAVGLEPAEVRAALREPGYEARVAKQTDAVLALGAGGVPAWVIDARLLMPGAQPHKVFARALERLGYQPVAND